MAIYTIAIILLIIMIVGITRQDNSSMKTVAYANDLTADGKITQLKKCLRYTVCTRSQIWLLS